MPTARGIMPYEALTFREMLIVAVFIYNNM